MSLAVLKNISLSNLKISAPCLLAHREGLAMSQKIEVIVDGKVKRLFLPDYDEQVLPGVKWGHHYAIFTPAFWTTVAWLDEVDEEYSAFRIGKTLEEEVAACLLGGYGIPAEIGLAAFYHVRDCGLLTGDPPSENT